MITKKYCDLCKVKVTFVNEFDNEGLHYTQYSCGHTSGRPLSKSNNFDRFCSLTGEKPYPYQTEGAAFGMNSSGRFAILDEPGCGKTIQALMVASEIGEKFLVVCKSGLKIQWARECYRWLNGALVQIIDSENEFILPGCKGYIISFDLLWRFKDLESFVKKLNVGFLIMDEVQHIKNSESKRTNAVRAIARTIDNAVALSGTPIEKNALEYFPILNILRPDKFPTKAGYERRFVDTYWDGRSIKYGGMRNYQAFHEYTKDFIIRRKREDVLPDLPTISRQFLFTDLGGDVEEAYKNVVKELQSFMLQKELSNFDRSNGILAYLTKMRHLTGLAKVDPVIDYTKDFLYDTNRKIVIFLHHKDVASLLSTKLEKENINHLKLSADLSPEQRQDVIDKFKSNGTRILLASTLASGEGLNLQFCSDCIIMERQWNPAKEEQAEGRFVRIGQEKDKVNAIYPIAVGTVDEFFSEIVERKRSNVGNTLDGTETKWSESSIITELAEVLSIKGGKKWGW